MEIDLSKTCRICLGEDDEMHYLFSEFDQGITLKEILTNTTRLEVEKDDGFPSRLCQNCTAVLVDFYNLKTIYEANLKQIKALLDNVAANLEEKIAENAAEAIDSDNSDSTQIEQVEDGDDYITIKVETSSDEEDSNAETDTGTQPELNDEESGGSVEYEYQEINTYSCPDCKEQFLHKEDIHTHMVTKHNLLSLNYDKMAQPISLIQIRKQTESSDPIKCKICHQVLPNEQSLKDHLDTHKKNVCFICGLGFLKKSYLKDHQETHCTEKRHVCNYCNKAFKRRTVLVKHRKIHTHPRQCICEICGKAFNDKGTLKTHITLLHVKERNYMCLICGVKFPLKATLEKHVKRHQNKEREFFCTQCPLGYKDKSSLDRHIFVKHSGRNTKSTCSDCGKQYTTLSNLFKHKRSCHLRQAADVTDENNT